MTRVIHTGDTHVGYQQYHAPERRRDFLEAFRQVLNDAVKLEVDAVVHAGDLFHDRRPDLEDLLGTIGVLRSLRAAGIPLLAIVGNHEGTHSAQWLDLFETLDLAVRLDETGQVVGNTTFYGLDYVPRSQRETLDYEFAPYDTDHAALVAHGRFTPFPHGNWEMRTVLSSATVDFDAVLLGDIHDHGRETVDGVPVTYCGSTERVSAEEREARGYNLVTFDQDVRITRRGIETRPFVFVDIELGPGEGTERVLDRVREATVEDAVLIVTVSGDGEPVTAADVELLGDELGALVTRVNDRRERTEEEAPTAVQFADPDAAVRERIREMGLSDVARDIDSEIRDLQLAKSNVREVVTETVRDRLTEPAAFEPAETADGDGTESESEDGQPTEQEEERPGEDEERAVPESPSTDVNEAGQATMGEFL